MKVSNLQGNQGNTLLDWSRMNNLRILMQHHITTTHLCNRMFNVILEDVGIERYAELGVAERPDESRRVFHNFFCAFLVLHDRVCACQRLDYLLRLLCFKFLLRRDGRRTCLALLSNFCQLRSFCRFFNMVLQMKTKMTSWFFARIARICKCNLLRIAYFRKLKFLGIA